MPYELQKEPDARFEYRSGSTGQPVATLRDIRGDGPVFHIVTDRGCYCLVEMTDKGGQMRSHWFPAACRALVALPNLG